MAFGLAEKGTSKQVKLIKKFSIIFMFGVVFSVLMVTQGLLLGKKLFYVLEIVELVGVYYLIKNFAKIEIKEDKKSKPKIKVTRYKIK